MVAGPVVGFIGLGDLGAPMAHLVGQAGWPLVLYARRAASLEPLLGLGAEIVEHARDVGRRADVVEVVVRDDAEVEQLLVGEGVLEAMRPGTVCAVHTTGHPDVCRRLNALGAARGVEVVDAPVSRGGRVRALAIEQGFPAPARPHALPGAKMAILVGAERSTFERCRPLFEVYGDPVLHLGPVGSGQAAKLVNNMLYAANIVMARDALLLARRLGVDAAAESRAVQASSGASWAMGNFERGLALDPPELAMRRIVDELAMQVPVAEALLRDEGIAGGSRIIDVGRDITTLLDRRGVPTLVSETEEGGPTS